MNKTSLAEQVLEALSRKGNCYFFGPFVLFFENKQVVVKMELHCQSDGLFLAYIENVAKSGGHAGRALEELVKIARSNKCPVYGNVDPSFGRTRRQLKKFYRSFGAVFKGDRFVIDLNEVAA